MKACRCSKASTLLEDDELTPDMVKKIATLLKIDSNVIHPSRLLAGILVELEHDGRVHVRTDVTHGDLMRTAKIALAHLVENPGDGDSFPDYYELLEDHVEKPAENYWNSCGRQKPFVFYK